MGIESQRRLRITLRSQQNLHDYTHSTCARLPYVALHVSQSWTLGGPSSTTVTLTDKLKVYTSAFSALCSRSVSGLIGFCSMRACIREKWTSATLPSRFSRTPRSYSTSSPYSTMFANRSGSRMRTNGQQRTGSSSIEPDQYKTDWLQQCIQQTNVWDCGMHDVVHCFYTTHHELDNPSQLDFCLRREPSQLF